MQVCKTMLKVVYSVLTEIISTASVFIFPYVEQAGLTYAYSMYFSWLFYISIGTMSFSVTI